MQRPTVRERVRYALDNLLSRGTTVLITGLFGTLALAVFLIALFLTVLGVRSPGGPSGFGPLLWHNLLRTLDPGTMSGDEGPALFLTSMLVVTLVGVFTFSALIGVLSTGLERKFAQLRKGRSRVIERNHVVVLGWSAEIFTVLDELVTANANQPRSVIVVLAARDKVEMEEEIAARLGRTGRTKIVCRSGNPADVDDIDIVNVQASRAIIVLSPAVDNPDTDVLKTLLAIINDPDRRPEPYHVVAEIQKLENVEAAHLIGKNEAQLVVADHAIAKVIAQTSRQSGLSVVYTELLNFAGDEIYVVSEPSLAGSSFGDAMDAFEEVTLIGLHDGKVRLNPPPDTPISAGDKLIVIAADDHPIEISPTRPEIAEDCIAPAAPVSSEPERTLVLGWNHRAPQLVTELDAHVAPGSEITIVSDAPDASDHMDAVRDSVRNEKIVCSVGDSSDRGVLESLDLPRFDHVVVLSYSDDADIQHADARTLTTLIHIRDIVTRTGAKVTITSEILDLRNRTLGEVAKPDDFIVSNHIVSLLLAQIAENSNLADVFDQLLAAEGADIYLRPAEDYVGWGRTVAFSTVVEAARRRREVAVGYRRAASSDRRDEHYGVVFNPPKSEQVVFDKGDKIIVLGDY